MIKAVIFDMDGVLVDNGDMHIRAFEIWSERHSQKFDREKLHSLFGMGNNDIFRLMYDIPMTDQQIAEYAEEKEAIYREILEKEIKPVEGLIDFLEDLSSHNIMCAVGSSGMKKNVDMVLDRCGIRKYFTVIVNGDMLTKTKPDPEVYLKCAEKLGVATSECIVCEDAFSGIKAARAAGMKVIALTTSYRRDLIKDYDYLIDNFREISYRTLME